jgi:hypothetical protein
MPEPQWFESSASPAPLKYVREADHEVSRAAHNALAEVGTDGQLDGLMRLVQAGRTPGAAAVLQAVASRTTGKANVSDDLTQEAGATLMKH